VPSFNHGRHGVFFVSAASRSAIGSVSATLKGPPNVTQVGTRREHLLCLPRLLAPHVLLSPLSRHVFTHAHAQQVGEGRPGEGSSRMATSSKDGAKGPPGVTQVIEY